MPLPKIDLDTLPCLETETGVFGSLANETAMVGVDDRVIAVMVYVYTAG